MKDGDANDRLSLEPPRPDYNRFSTLAVVVVLSGLLLASGVLGYFGWTSTDNSVPATGYVAMALGVIFSLIVGVGLMALVFYSNRSGYDEPAVLVSQPPRDRVADEKDHHGHVPER